MEPEPNNKFITDIEKLLIHLRHPTAIPSMSQEWKIHILFRDGKPIEAQWTDFTNKEFSNRTVKISSPLKHWNNGFLHFFIENEKGIIPTTELKISEEYLLENNLSVVIQAPAICSLGTYPIGMALDDSDV